jgi:hypothetical protein
VWYVTRHGNSWTYVANFYNPDHTCDEVRYVLWNAVLSEEQISNFIRLNLERGDSFHEVLSDDGRVWRNTTNTLYASEKALISTDSGHAHGTVIEIGTEGYARYSNNAEAQKATESNRSPVVPNIEDLKPVQM